MKVGEIDLYLYNPCYRWSKRFSMERWGTIKAGGEQQATGGGLPVSVTHHPLA
jgi:hypothetical protein